MTATTTFRHLAALDLRLARRRVDAMFRDAGGRRTIIMVGVALVLFHLIAIPVARSLTADGDAASRDAAIAATLLFVLPWITSQALTNATRALYSRGDLDLLLASPAPAQAILSARALAIACESIISVSIFLLPVANVLAWLGGIGWLGIYPTLVACGFAGTALGLLLTMALFRFAGPRRTRVLAQVFATLVGASFAIGLQLANLAPLSLRAFVQRAHGSADHATILSLVSLPVRAARGDLPAIAATLGGSAGLFIAVSLVLANAFTRGFVRAVDLPAARGRVDGRIRFRPGAMAALRRKEWRLVLRDPWLASQLLLQIAYTLPLCFVLWETLGAGTSVLAAIAPAVVVIATQLSGSLAFVTLSTEDAPDFLRTAPLTRGQIERAKLSAVAIPLAVLVGAPVLLMAQDAPLVAATTLLFAACGAVSSALLNLWRAAPARRGDLMRRDGQPKIIGILEHVLALLWAVTAALGNAGSPWLIAVAGLAVGVLWLNRPARAPMVPA